MVLISGIVSWYYNTIIAWVLYYLFNSFSDSFFQTNPFLMITIILLSCRFRLAYGADLWNCELVLQHHHSLGAVPCLFNDSISGCFINGFGTHVCVPYPSMQKPFRDSFFQTNPFLMITIILLSCRFRLAYGADLWNCELV